MRQSRIDSPERPAGAVRIELVASRARVSATTRSWNAGSRTWTEPSIGLAVFVVVDPGPGRSSVRTLVSTRAACFGVLQYLMSGASGDSTYFAKMRSASVRVAAEVRAGVEAGFDGVEAQPRGFACEGEDGGEVALLGGGVGVEPGLDEPPGAHSPRALASAEM